MPKPITALSDIEQGKAELKGQTTVKIISRTTDHKGAYLFSFRRHR